MFICRLLIVTAAVLLLATATVFMSGPKEVGSKRPSAIAWEMSAAAGHNQQSSASRQLVRIWVHGDDIYPDVARIGPGKILLQAENELSSDITLVVEQVTEGQAPQGQAPQIVATISAPQQAKRASRDLTLSAGEYLFYEQSRPGVKGKIIVEPL